MTGPPLPEVLPRCRCPRVCYNPIFPSDRDFLCDFCLVGCDDCSCAGEDNGPEGQPCCAGRGARWPPPPSPPTSPPASEDEEEAEAPRVTGPPLPEVLPRCRCPRSCYDPVFPSDRDLLCDFCLVGCDDGSCAGEGNGPEGQPCRVNRGADAPAACGGRAARGPTEAGGPSCTERNPTEEARQARKRRLNTTSSGTPPFVARQRHASTGANGAPGRAPRTRRSRCAAYRRVAALSNSMGSLILAAQRADEEEGL